MIGVLEMSILGNPYNLQKRMVDQINHRINVVNGIVASRNPNDTFNCYIAGETVIYPNIPTFSRNPKLGPGDKVVIEFINGCRETPAILAPEDIREQPDTTPTTVEGEIFITYWTGTNGYIRSFSTNGELATTWTGENYNTQHNAVCVDNAGNVFYISFNNKIIKYSSTGVALANIIVSYQVISIAISSDGYIYTRENTATDNNIIIKRDPVTLAEISSFQLIPWTNGFYGLAFYDNDKFYIVNSTSDEIQMWKFSTGAKLASRAVTASKTSLTALAYASGNTKVMGNDFGHDAWTVPIALGAGETDFPAAFTRTFGVASKDGHFYILGNNSDGGIIYLGKYTEAGAEVWVIEAVEAGYYPSSVGVYPF